MSNDFAVDQALEDVPIFMRGFMTEIKEDIEKVLDVKHMVVDNMVKNKALMNKVIDQLLRLTDG